MGTPGAQPPTVKPSQQAKATQLVNDYNKQASALAAVVMQLWNLRAEIGDVGCGQVMISGDGWTGNALESIPILKVIGQNYPPQFPTGMLINMREQRNGSHFDATKQANFAMPPGYTATAESMRNHQAAIDYAEANGVDFITAATIIERGTK